MLDKPYLHACERTFQHLLNHSCQEFFWYLHSLHVSTACVAKGFVKVASLTEAHLRPFRKIVGELFTMINNVCRFPKIRTSWKQSSSVRALHRPHAQARASALPCRRRSAPRGNTDLGTSPMCTCQSSS